MRVIVKIATDSEKVADDISRRFENIPDIYFRFNATHGAGEITLEEALAAHGKENSNAG